MRKELERVNPSDVGLSSKAIDRYISSLEKSSTEMHGIMISRYNKVCAEGWWKPYSPMLRHGLQSLTKSYTSTAIGILFSQGKIKLNERLVDILPEYMPNEISENLSLLTVHDLLCLGSGLEVMQDRTKKEWIYDFFASEFVNRPGSEFFYSGVVSSILGAVVREKTGMGLMDYLKPRLFDKIGIISENLKWIEHPDGLEYGGGGLFATTEDNLRLGLLYLNEGYWEGEEILSRDWVAKATTSQMDNGNETAADSKVGYGYQMWMCQPEGVFRFDGAHGQFTIIDPKLELVISINQYAEGTFVQDTLDITWKYLSEARGEDNCDHILAERLKSLSIKRDETRPIPGYANKLLNKKFHLEPNEFYLIPRVYNILSHKLPKGIKTLEFSLEDGAIVIDTAYGNNKYALNVSLDGIDRLSRVFVAQDLPEMVYASGYWENENEINIKLKYIETCYDVSFKIIFSSDGIQLVYTDNMPFSENFNKEIRIKSI